MIVSLALWATEVAPLSQVAGGCARRSPLPSRIARDRLTIGAAGFTRRVQRHAAPVGDGQARVARAA
jgi:hypothetical protein